MTKLKKKFAILVLTCFALSCSAIFVNTTTEARADTYYGNVCNTEISIVENTPGKEISPRLLVTLSLTLNGGNGKVWATVKNDFQLFPSTVNVIVQLFYSTSYCEDYNKMTMIKIDSIEDLNMGSTFTVPASTDGKERFWMARMRYRENNGSWNERTVSARYSASGEYMGLT